MAKPQLKEKEKELLTILKTEINQLADDKAVTISKKSQHAADRNIIEKECEESFFNDIQKQLEKDTEVCKLFYDQLKLDNPILFDKLSKEALNAFQKMGE